eukprot:gene14263-biopygen20093
MRRINVSTFVLQGGEVGIARATPDNAHRMIPMRVRPLAPPRTAPQRRRAGAPARRDVQYRMSPHAR